MSMTLNRTVILGEHSITARELTVGEIRTWMKRLAGESEHDPVGAVLLEEISLADLKEMTDATDEQLDGLKPSQLRQLYAACVEVNPDFFALRERIEGLGKSVLARLSNASNATPAL